MPPDAPPTRRRPPRTQRAMVAIGVLDAVVLLFPPIQWWLADGNATISLAYFLLAGLAVVLSVALIHHLDAGGEDR